MRNRNRLALLMFAVVLAGSARAQVDVAVADVAKGAGRTVKVVSKGVGRTVGVIVSSVPVAVGTAVVSGVVAGAATFATSIANSSAHIAVTEGTLVVKTSVIASADAAGGVLKAGWHLVSPRTTVDASVVETDDEKQPLKDITTQSAKTGWHHLFHRGSGDDDTRDSDSQEQ
jgi:hypothetical protein